MKQHLESHWPEHIEMTTLNYEQPPENVYGRARSMYDFAPAPAPVRPIFDFRQNNGPATPNLGNGLSLPTACVCLIFR